MSNVSKHIKIDREVLTPDNLHKYLTAGTNLPDGLSGDQKEEIITERMDSALSSLQKGTVISEKELGFQMVNDKARIGVYADTSGTVNLNGAFRVSAELPDSQYTFTTSGEINLSNNSDQNSLQVTTGLGYSHVTPDNTDWDLSWEVSAGAKITDQTSASIRGEVEWAKNTSRLFADVAIDHNDNQTDTNIRLGLKEEVLHELSIPFVGDTLEVTGGLASNNFETPKAFAEIGFKF